MLKTSNFKLYGLVVPLVLGTVGKMVKTNPAMAIPPPRTFLKSQRQVNKPILSNTYGGNDVPVGETLAVEGNGGYRPPPNFPPGQVAQSELPNPITPPAPPPEPVRTPEAPPPSPLEVPVSPISPVEEGPEVEEAIAIEGFEFIGNTAFSSEELAEALAEFTNRPLTFAELLQAETAITKYYVDAGFINSGAAIPAGQNLSGGTVTIQIIEGGLEDIIVNIDGRLNPGYVRSRLAIAAGTPLNVNRLLGALQKLQLDPLIDSLSAELSAGSRPERSLLRVEVEPADTFSVSLNIDNGRSPSVGSFRRGGEIREANLLGLGDGLAVSYANTDGSDKYGIRYLLPVNPRNGAIALEYDRTTSDIVEPPFDRADIEGDSERYALTYRQPIYETPTRELAFGLTLSHQQSQTSVLGVNEPLSPGASDRGETRVSAVRFFQAWTQRNANSVLAARSQFNLGVGVLDATVNAEPPDSRFFSWRGQAQYVRLLAPETLLVIRSDVQLAGRALVPLEQFAVGGLGSVRGYRQDFLLTDNGVLVSAEALLPLVRIGEEGVIQVVPFIDFGTGWNSSGVEDPEDNTLLGAGVGLQLRLDDKLTGRIDYGIPLIEVTSTEERTWQENGVYFSVIYNPF